MPKWTTPWLASHSVAATLTPEFSLAYSLRGKVRAWWPVQSRTVPRFGTVTPACFTAASRSAGVVLARGGGGGRTRAAAGGGEGFHRGLVLMLARVLHGQRRP